jgi:hypothetical protein
MQDIWSGTFEDKPIVPKNPHNRCPLAQQFSTWTAELRGQLGEKPTRPALEAAKVQLLDRYMGFRASAPRTCRDRTSSRAHACIYHVFTEAYDYLHTKWLTSAPLPAPTAQPVEARRPRPGELYIPDREEK